MVRLRALVGFRPLVLPVVLLFLLGVLAPSSGAGSVAAAGFHPLNRPIGTRFISDQELAGRKPSDAECRKKFGVPCYSPQEMQNAYNVTPLLNSNINGAGQTIVIIDSYGSPSIRHDLEVFDRAFGLPAPPSFQILAPLGKKAFDPNNATMVGWAQETSLDVEWAHALAPGASIVLLTSPVAETEGVHGMPQFLTLEQYALDRHLGQIISQSWGATEETLKGPDGQQVVAQFEAFYANAAAQGVTVFASSGDTGSANVNDKGQIYPFPTLIYPASSPWVTAVGGTTLAADTSGNYQGEVVWNDNASYGVPIAGGGGISHLFVEPSFQKGLPKSMQNVLNGNRGIPDISYNADPYSGILVHLSYDSADTGWWIFGGTSEGSPQWAGIIADGNQLAGHSLGYLNPALYQLGNSSNYGTSLHDLTVGDNANLGVSGFTAANGWDLTTGWGSPNAANLLPALAAN